MAKSDDGPDFYFVDDFGEIRSSFEVLAERLVVLERVSEALMSFRFSEKQFRILSFLNENEGLLYYQLVEKFSLKRGMPASTVRWNLNKLRDAGLVVAGDRYNKGVPVRLTEVGKKLADIFKNTHYGKEANAFNMKQSILPNNDGDGSEEISVTTPQL
ncbi:MAG: hypothetical protein ACE5Z5_00585 [Candidatus Bathyarchaeia archaeon]